MVNVECSKTLTKETEIIDHGYQKLVFSKCPLVTHPIKIHHEKKSFMPFI